MAKGSSSVSVIAVVLMMMMAVVVVRGQTTSNPQINECVNNLLTLQTCLPFVSGNSNHPTPNCCEAMGKVVVDKPKCLCVLIKYHDDPIFNSFHINISYAVQMPSKCNNAAADINKCPGLLGLDPNSPDAQIFKVNNSSSTPASPTPKAAASPPPQAGGTTGIRNHSWWWSGIVIATTIWMHVTSFLVIL